MGDTAHQQWEACTPAYAHVWKEGSIQPYQENRAQHAATLDLQRVCKNSHPIVVPPPTPLQSSIVALVLVGDCNSQRLARPTPQQPQLRYRQL